MKLYLGLNPVDEGQCGNVEMGVYRAIKKKKILKEDQSGFSFSGRHTKKVLHKVICVSLLI